jgi:hypothetical protein
MEYVDSHSEYTTGEPTVFPLSQDDKEVNLESTSADIKIPNKLSRATFEKTDRGEELNEVNSVDELFESLDS